MRQSNSGRAIANERKYPYIVELSAPNEELNFELSRRIMNFHKSRKILARHGRTILREGHYFRWCFSDMATAGEFMEEFGGEFERPVPRRR
jgi:hypothetical protein